MRDYIEGRPIAPIRSTVASAILQASMFDRTSVLYDPFCGSGTILFEALMLRENIPSGYFRANRLGNRSSQGWSFSNLPFHNEQEWEQVKQEADSKIWELKKPNLARIYGSDTDPEALHLVFSVLHNSMAPWKDVVFVKMMDYTNFKPRLKPTLVVTNPPHGVRMGKVEELQKLYKDLPNVLESKIKPGSRMVVYTVPTLAKQIPGIKVGPLGIARTEKSDAQVYQFRFPIQGQSSKPPGPA